MARMNVVARAMPCSKPPLGNAFAWADAVSTFVSRRAILSCLVFTAVAVPCCKRGMPLFIMASCHACKLTALTLRCHLPLVTADVTPAIIRSAAAAAACPGATVTRFTPFLMYVPAPFRLVDHLPSHSCAFTRAIYYISLEVGELLLTPLDCIRW